MLMSMPKAMHHFESGYWSSTEVWDCLALGPPLKCVGPLKIFCVGASIYVSNFREILSQRFMNAYEV